MPHACRPAQLPTRTLFLINTISYHPFVHTQTRTCTHTREGPDSWCWISLHRCFEDILSLSPNQVRGKSKPQQKPYTLSAMVVLFTDSEHLLKHAMGRRTPCFSYMLLPNNLGTGAKIGLPVSEWCHISSVSHEEVCHQSAHSGWSQPKPLQLPDVKWIKTNEWRQR